MSLYSAEIMRTKLCPFVRYAGNGIAAINRHPDPKIEANCMCRASDCAMWIGSESVGDCGLKRKD